MIFVFYIFWHYKAPPYDFMMHTIVLSCSVMSHSLQPYGLQSARLLCPGDSPGKNTGKNTKNGKNTIPSSRGSSPPRDPTYLSPLLHWQASCLPLAPGNLMIRL